MTQQIYKKKNSWKNLEEAIEDYYLYHPIEYYLKFPEFAVKKLGLETNLLDTLNKDINKRTREDIRQWMKDSKLTFQELIYVGW